MTWNSGSSGVRTELLYELDGQSIGVENVSEGVWTGVCCPFTSGVDVVSRRCGGGTCLVWGVLRLASGKVTDLGVEEGLGRCQSDDLMHDPH